ncbi:MAG: hypothetical protein HOY69_31330 [Streptomyces sp.]|nr:hypothetical protein [Streptomyces sp.]
MTAQRVTGGGIALAAFRSPGPGFVPTVPQYLLPAEVGLAGYAPVVTGSLLSVTPQIVLFLSLRGSGASTSSQGP